MHLQSISISILDEHTHATELERLLEPLLAGQDMGLLSEAGCPAVADPGAALVRLAHQKNIRVVPLVGPSSISVGAHGIGIEWSAVRISRISPRRSGVRSPPKWLSWKKLHQLRDQTQIFIETPYRNQKVLACLISACRKDTVLSISSSLTTEEEYHFNQDS